MTNTDIVFKVRMQIFEDWRWRRLSWQEIKAKYGFGKTWFFKFRKRFLKDGHEGLKKTY